MNENREPKLTRREWAQIEGRKGGSKKSLAKTEAAKLRAKPSPERCQQVKDRLGKSAVISPRERTLLCLRFGIFGEDFHTCREIAMRFGVSTSCVNYWQGMALRKLGL